MQPADEVKNEREDKEEEVVLAEVVDRVGIVTLNRPKARNALNTALRLAIRTAVRQMGEDPGVDVIIITGADPAFCAGVDLKEIASSDRNFSNAAEVEPFGEAPLPPTGKPIIGAINGVAVTGGLELALDCDFLVASERARFADTHSRVGIQPAWGLTVRLPQAVGIRRAKEMSATGNYVDASTALSWGLVNHVVSHDELLPFCRSLAGDIGSNDGDAVAAIFETYDQGSEATGADAWRIEAANARRWLDEGRGRSQDVARRREAIQERGRSQASRPTAP